MRHRFVLSIALISAGIGCAGNPPKVATPPDSKEPMAAVADRLAKNPNGPWAEQDTRALRAGGQPALDLLIADAGPAPSEDQRARIDAVAQQRDAYASHLYWYTDLEAAKSAARASHKPILALRMLGNLTEELSCANSRFFRTVLYPNEKVSADLRDGFILYWSSERPAPKITIDFGDGRKIERTVTGNSIHYVLDENGNPIDAIPGLYSPEHFLQAVDAAHQLYDGLPVATAARQETIRQYHTSAIDFGMATYASDFVGAHVPSVPFPGVTIPAPSNMLFIPSNLAVPVAVGKGIVERPMVRAMLPATMDRAAIDTVPWDKLAASHGDPEQIDEASRKLILAKHPMDWSDPSSPRLLGANDFDAMIASFERAMAEDTEKNEIGIHTYIHSWFAAEPTIDFATLNQRVYSQLFLTPKSDPWLGLVPPSTYTGIENDGVIPQR